MKGTGFRAETMTTLPADLTPYGQVWWVGCLTSLGTVGETQLVEFDRAGGSLLLSVENSNCDASNATTKAVADQLIAPLGTDGLVFGPSFGAGTFNPSALHAATTTPNALTTFPANTSGSVDAKNLPRRNVLVRPTAGSRYAQALVWDRSDLIGQVGGRVAIVGDVNWTAGTTGTEIAVNLATYLKGVAR